MIDRVYNLLNSKTAIQTLNLLTEALTNLFKSDGWIALDFFLNTMGNSFQIYDVIAGMIYRKREYKELEIYGNEISRFSPPYKNSKYFQTKNKRKKKLRGYYLFL